jgi:MFS family permease
MLMAAFMILLSWSLTVPYGWVDKLHFIHSESLQYFFFAIVALNVNRNDFQMLTASRLIGGLGCGIFFILLPGYMKELLGLHANGAVIVDILITQFGLGICIQYFAGKLLNTHFDFNLNSLEISHPDQTRKYIYIYLYILKVTQFTSTHE